MHRMCNGVGLFKLSTTFVVLIEDNCTTLRRKLSELDKLSSEVSSLRTSATPSEQLHPLASWSNSYPSDADSPLSLTLKVARGPLLDISQMSFSVFLPPFSHAENALLYPA